MSRERDAARRPRVGIVGGGAAGSLVAVNLLREADSPVEIILIDESGEFGPGVPYRTRNPEHRLNVPAARMSALADDPGHFLDWLRESRPDISEDAYLPRATYGEYLEDLLARAEAERRPEVELTRITGRVTEIVPSGSGARLILEDWQTKVDHVVIATGPIAGGDPVPVPDSLKESGVYIPGAWDESTILPARADRDVLIVGTGLTMVDVALTLAAGRDGPRLRAVSRNGLAPKRHRPGLTSISTPEIPPEGPLSIGDLLGAFTGELVRASLEGRDWRDAIDSFRSVTPDAWRRLPTGGKKWFLTHVNRVWEVHRYRMAPEVASRFEELTLSGRLEISAGRIGSIEEAGSRVRVTLLSEAGAEVTEFDRVIAACGAGTDVTRDAPAPIPGLIGSGSLRPDDLGLGLDVDPDGAARDAEGNRSPIFSVLGSLRRGVDWETIGITELKRQSADIASRLAAELSGSPSGRGVDMEGV